MSHRFIPKDWLPIKLWHMQPGRPFEVASEVIYTNAVIRLVIPPGFRCDLASIPRWLLWMPGLNVSGRNARAALIHDFLYDRQIVDREIADALFLSVMKADGVGWFARSAMYLAVRAFGGTAWRENRSDPKKLGGTAELK